MADYVSKYTGSEVDGILDDAIELPLITNQDQGKSLMVGAQGPEWDYALPQTDASNRLLWVTDNGHILSWADPSDVLPSIDVALELKDIDGFATGKYLRGSGGTAHPYWGDGDIPDYSSGNKGALLTVAPCYYGNFLEWVEPSETIEDGDVLRYSSTSGFVWDKPNSLLPSFNNGFAGMVLSPNGSGDVTWIDVLPAYSIANAGSVLTINSQGSLTWDVPASGLPVDGCEGQILMLYNSEPTWGDIPEKIPAANSEDIGKVLAANASCDLQWMTPDEAAALYAEYHNE